MLNPAAFFIGALLVGYLLMAGWIVWTLIGMFIMREITALELALYGGCYLVLALGAIAAWGRPLGSLLLLTGIASTIGYPIIQKAHNRALLLQMQLADLQDNLKRIDERPDIPYSYHKVADIYYEREQYGKALEFYSRCLKLGDDPGIKWRIRKCQDEIRRAETGEKPCIGCGAENPREARVCVKCGREFPSNLDLLEPFRGKKLLTFIVWTLVGSLVLGLLLGFLQAVNTFWLALLFLIALTCFFVYIYVRLSA